MPDLIGKVRFLECGKKAPEGSRFKGILSAYSLIGWYNYTERDEAVDEKKELTVNSNGFLGYTSHQGKEKTFTHQGWLSEDKTGAFKRDIAEAFSKKGNLCWDTVISLRNFELAEKFDMLTVDDWACAINKALPKFFKKCRLENSNMIFWMNFHTNRKNPHIHLTFLEKKQTRTKGAFTQKQLDSLKRFVYTEAGVRVKLAEKVNTASEEYFKHKDENMNMILQSIKLSFEKVESLHDLYKILPKKGRLQYNSANMAPYKTAINDQIKKLLQDDAIKPYYDEWLNKVDTITNVMNEAAGDEISTFKNAEMDHLYSLVGNAILKNFKENQRIKFEVEIDAAQIKEHDSKHTVVYLPEDDMSVLVSKNKIKQLDHDRFQITFDRSEYESLHSEDKIDPQSLYELYTKKEAPQNKLESDSKTFSGNALSAPCLKKVRHMSAADNLNKLKNEIRKAISYDTNEKEKDLDIYLHNGRSYHS